MNKWARTRYLYCWDRAHRIARLSIQQDHCTGSRDGRVEQKVHSGRELVVDTNHVDVTLCNDTASHVVDRRLKTLLFGESMLRKLEQARAVDIGVESRSSRRLCKTTAMFNVDSLFFPGHSEWQDQPMSFKNTRLKTMVECEVSGNHRFVLVISKLGSANSVSKFRISSTTVLFISSMLICRPT